ncbi:MAG: histidinol-phosphate aminotransferase family protein, partial [Erysipelotrichaceae bacterium]|nr:histidinol-phosphate aminotransferase family protein [Erysipelotrichaceae bacterium]
MKKINEYAPVQTSGILLNANESPFDFDRYIKEELVKLLSEFSFQRYPNDTYEELLKAYANYAGIEEDQVICGNGSDELLGLIIGLTITQGKKLLTFKKDFGMYNYYTSMFQGEVVTYDQPITEDFDSAKFIETAKKENVAIIMISNPNNPTGKLIPVSSIKDILEGLKEIPVVIDEAYIEFSEEGSSMMPYLEDYPNLIITRTLSKAFGLASIRCGFLATNKERMATIKPNKVPFNVSTFSEKVATLLLNKIDFMKK